MTRGNVEQFKNGFLSGWAADESSDPVELRVIIDGNELGTVFANGPREDVNSAGMALGNSGFAIFIPTTLYAREGCTAEVVAIGDSDPIPGSPFVIQPLTSNHPRKGSAVDNTLPTVDDNGSNLTSIREKTVTGNVERFDGRQVSGWALDGTETPAKLNVFIDGDLYGQVTADHYREDLVQAKLTAISCGFAVEIPRMFFWRAGCTVEVFEVSTGEMIFGSPFLVPPGSQNIDQAQHDLGALATAVTKISNGTSSIDAVRSNISVVVGWLQQNVDRMIALESQREIEFEKFSGLVEAAGGIGEGVGHLFRMVKESHPQVFLPTLTPVVSIIIPVYNNFALTYDCIKSIAEVNNSIPFEIIIVDDCSTDETVLSPLVFVGNVSTLRTPRNQGFVEACNLGAKKASGEFLLFLNNDTIVSDGWLDALTKTIRTSASIGIVGSRLIYPDGILQEAGGVIWRDGTGWNWGNGQDKDHPGYSFMRDVDYVSGAALMIRRILFESLDGFDTLFAPAYYEDTDLCFRVHAAGHRVVVQPASTIIHLEGQSNGRSVSTGLKKYQVVNAKKFRERWHDVLQAHGISGVNPQREANRWVKKQAIFIDETTPTPDQDAGSNAAYEHMLSLQRLGYKVVFLPADNMARIPGYTERLQAEGIECWFAPYAWSVEEYFRRTGSEFDLVYVHRKTNLTRYYDVIRKYVPGAAVVFNFADIHALRELREAEISGEPKKRLDALRRELKAESALVKVADASIVHSLFEEQFIKRDHPSSAVKTVPWPFEALDTVPGHEGRSGIAFVGGFNHRPNVDAVDWFVSSAWPMLLASVGNHNFKIVGSNMPARFSETMAPQVDAIGFVPDLHSFLDTVAVTVAPLRFGAGLKGKVLSSLARGVPCVMTSVAAEGINLPPPLRELVQDSPLNSTMLIRRLLQDRAFWSKISTHCIEFVKEGFSRELVDKLMAETIDLAARKRRLRR